MLENKLLLAINNDDMNSPLVTVITEIFNEGYQLFLEGAEINEKFLVHSSITDLELYSKEILFELCKKNQLCKKIKIEYLGFHQIRISELK